MKRAGVFALALIAAPVGAQAPPPQQGPPPARTVVQKIARASLQCTVPYERDDQRPSRQSYLDALAKCEAALPSLDAVLAENPDATPADRAYHAEKVFDVRRRIGDIYSGQDAGPRGRLVEHSARACAAYEEALVAYNRIDLAARTSPTRVIGLVPLVRSLETCRKTHGAPAFVADLPVPPRYEPPPPPPPGTLPGDLHAVVTPCLTGYLDREAPLPRRLETCERAAAWLPAVRARHPDANSGHLFTYDIQFVSVHTYLGVMQMQFDGRASPRACASLDTAMKARAAMSSGGFLFVGPLLDALAVNPQTAACRRQ